MIAMMMMMTIVVILILIMMMTLLSANPMSALALYNTYQIINN